MLLKFDELVELINRSMYIRNGVMLGSKATAKAILKAEEAAEQCFRIPINVNYVEAKSELALMDEIEFRHGIHEDRWNILRSLLEQQAAEGNDGQNDVLTFGAGGV